MAGSALTGLVLGTTNAGKVRELLELLAPHRIACVPLTGLKGAVEVDETGATFAENAALKAATQARALGRWVLAEDSGLVVDALDGQPGVHSARFAARAGRVPSASGADDANSALLLERLAGVRGSDRSAHYACHAALADPTGRIVAVSHGLCRGRIAESASGVGGFGYDPLFTVAEYHRTFGDIHPAVKAVISHRGRAMRAMIPGILQNLPQRHKA